MKKSVCVLIFALLLVGMTGCQRGSETNSPDSVQIVSSSEAGAAKSENETALSLSNNEIDVDLTKLSGTMVYSEVSNMMTSPEDFEGKSVKMKGRFNVVELEGVRYFSCQISDASACCSQGLEFVLKNERVFPDEYPEVGDKITVVGVFEIYYDNGYEYIRLADAEIV